MLVAARALSADLFAVDFRKRQDCVRVVTASARGVFHVGAVGVFDTDILVAVETSGADLAAGAIGMPVPDRIMAGAAADPGVRGPGELHGIDIMVFPYC